MTDTPNDPLTTGKNLLAATQPEFCEYKQKTALLEQYAKDCKEYAEALQRKLATADQRLQQKTQALNIAIYVAIAAVILTVFLLLCLFVSKNTNRYSQRPGQERRQCPHPTRTTSTPPATGLQEESFGVSYPLLDFSRVRCTYFQTSRVPFSVSSLA